MDELPRQALLAELDAISLTEPHADQRLRRLKVLLPKVRQLGDEALLARLFIEQGKNHALLFEFAEAQTLLNEGIRLATRLELSGLLLEGRLAQGGIHYGNGDFFRALEVWLKTLEEASKFSQMNLCAQAYVGIGKVYYAFDDFSSAVRAHAMAQEIANGLGDLRLSCEIAINLAADYYRLHDTASSMASIIQAQQIMAQGKLDLPEWDGEISSYIGLIHFEQGDYERAEAHLLSALAILRACGSVWGQVHVQLALGRTYLKLGDPRRASDYLKEVVAQQSLGVVGGMQVQTEELLAGLLVEQGDYQGALHHYKRLQQLQSEQFRSHGTTLRLSKHMLGRLADLEFRLQLERYRLQLASE
ncbi:tetratricopeptide repeat protein [Chitinilyticum piscinae]|uniref:Tetratricopeptide repeat protein n=1 Tax=Chitinilyticum piscinae TaxID=2866724 RepID=A0A8J7FUX2_9NEIS|nr:tetratricopeptide repeat protein [Chitinilyticum piscinae]MBE9607775.1 tetratricopeptide repeat protein [Chitinilyticum piscinae]